MRRMYGFVSLGGGILRHAPPAPVLRGAYVHGATWRVQNPASTRRRARAHVWCCAERGGIATAAAVTGKEELSTVAENGANIIDVLQERGLFDAGTGDLESLRAHCSNPIVVYGGFDPTADSLHLGNLLALITLRWFQKCGHRVIALLGGATGRIGDPSGKSVERPALSESLLEHNARGIERNIRTILGPEALVVNNYDWFSGVTFLDFLRDVGRHARVNTMIGKDMVKKRLESSDGISYTEFTYQLLQGYDFMHLSREYGVSVQVGGSDQWGNITAGTELTRKLCSGQVHGVTFPLLTTADGRKFGKSEKGAIWLAEDKLTPYNFYQHLFRTADDDIGTFLRRLTDLPIPEIEAIVQRMRTGAEGYRANDAQRVLAAEVTRLVHGQKGLDAALAATEAVKPGGQAQLTPDALEAIAQDMPSVTLSKDAVVDSTVIQLMVDARLQKSKGEARRLLNNGGVYVNNVKITDANARVKASDLVGDSMLLLAAGKKNKLLVRVQ